MNGEEKQLNTHFSQTCFLVKLFYALEDSLIETIELNDNVYRNFSEIITHMPCDIIALYRIKMSRVFFCDYCEFFLHNCVTKLYSLFDLFNGSCHVCMMR